jgi:uncharacterized membrane protein YfcA
VIDASPAGWRFLLIAGLVAGAVNAVAGGGSLLVFPALAGGGASPRSRRTSPTPWPSGPATSATCWACASSCAANGRRILATSAVGVAGAIVGCILLLILPGAVFDAVVPALVLLASVVLALSPQIKRWIGAPEPGAPDRTGRAPSRGVRPRPSTAATSAAPSA